MGTNYTKSTITSGFASTTNINNERTNIEDALDRSLSRHGDTPNQMEAEIDMNSNRIINVGEPLNNNDALRLQDITDAAKTATASATAITDSGAFYDSDNVEGALQEVGNGSLADDGWRYRNTAVYSSGTVFILENVDLSSEYHVDRRIKAEGSATGTIYGTISAVDYNSTNANDTTVTVVWDSGSLSNETLTVWVGPPVINTNIPWPWVDVRALGAVGDGTTDDTVAWQAAIDTGLPIKAGPNKTYVVSALTASSDLIIDLNGSALRHQAGTASAMLTLSGAASEVDIENGVFDGQDISTASRQQLVSIVGGITRLYLRRCRFLNSTSSSVGGTVTGDFWADGCDFIDSEDYPIQISSASTHIVSNCRIKFDSGKSAADVNVRAIQPSNCASVIVEGCYINGGRQYRDGVWNNACDHVSITGNVIEEFEDDSVTFVGACNHAVISGNILSGSNTTGGVVSTSGSSVRNLTITGNTFDDGIRAIYLFQAEQVTVTGNSIKNYDYAMVLVTAQPSQDIVFANNTLEAVAETGLDLGASDNIIIDGNLFGTHSNVAGLAVFGSTATNVKVRGNKFRNLSNRAVQTGNANWEVSGNHFDLVPERCISVGDSAGTVGLVANDNVFDQCDQPLTVVSGNGTSRIVFNDNYCLSETDQTASGNPGAQFGDALDFTANGNIFVNYRRGADSGAGSDYGIFVGNNERNCGATTTLGSTTTNSVANNL